MLAGSAGWLWRSGKPSADDSRDLRRDVPRRLDGKMRLALPQLARHTLPHRYVNASIDDDKSIRAIDEAQTARFEILTREVHQHEKYIGLDQLEHTDGLRVSGFQTEQFALH